MLPLEDKFGDIVAKARRGKNIPTTDLASAIGLTEADLADIFTYKLTPPDDTIRKLAKILSLNPDALLDSAHARWAPHPIALDGFVVISSPYDDYIVNAYLIWDKVTKQAVLFDTGADLVALDNVISENQLKVELLLLTHTHTDHVILLDKVIEKYQPKIFTSPREPAHGAQPTKEGEQFKINSITIEVRETDGHSVGGLTFVVTGIVGAPTIAIVGDAIFSGSMGGAMISYENLTRNIRQKILSLPDATILCPGHGPLTTVGEEKKHNPFFA